MSQRILPAPSMVPQQSMTVGVMNLTFRGYVAIEAMKGILASTSPDEMIDHQIVAREAYLMADAFINEAKDQNV